MMRSKKVSRTAVLLCVVLALFGCKNDSTSQNQKQITTQDISQAEKPVISAEKFEGVDELRTMATQEKLLVAIKITNFNRFRVSEIKQKVTKQVEKDYPKMDVTVTPDKKIFMEIDKFEKNAPAKKSDKAIDKRIKALIKLSKEK